MTQAPPPPLRAGRSAATQPPAPPRLAFDCLVRSNTDGDARVAGLLALALPFPLALPLPLSLSLLSSLPPSPNPSSIYLSLSLSPSPPLPRSLERSAQIARPPDRLIDGSIDRSIACSLARSLASSLALFLLSLLNPKRPIHCRNRRECVSKPGRQGLWRRIHALLTARVSEVAR